MKNKDLKKGKESIIGKIIYGFLLFMPLLAILVTCGYAMFNKNAYQSYADNRTTINQSVDLEDLVISETYYINTEEITVTEGTLYIQANNITIIGGLDTSGRNQIRLSIVNTRPALTFMGQNLSNIYIYLDTGNYSGISFEYLGQSNNSYVGTIQFYKPQTSSNFTLDNVFYYSVDKVEQSDLFNWAENSLIYTGISNTCTQLAITNTFIPLLLTYWLIISVIYILYDIILMILIILHNKIHQIQDSI